MIFSSWNFIIFAFPQVFSSDTRSRSFVNLPLSINNPNNHNRLFHTKRILHQLTDTGWDWPRPTWTWSSPQLPSLTTRVKRCMGSVFHGSSYAAEALAAPNVPFPQPQ